MIISLRHKYAFFCITKTGSTAIEGMLHHYNNIHIHGRAGLKHIDYKTYQEHLVPLLALDDPKELETICIIREPLERLASAFRYRTRESLRDPAHFNHDCCTHGLAFADFVEAYLSPHPPRFARIRQQFEFLIDSAGNLEVDTMFRYEDLGSFVAYMSERTGRELSLPQKNVSPTLQTEQYELSGPLKRKLEKRLAQDIELYRSLEPRGRPEPSL